MTYDPYNPRSYRREEPEYMRFRNRLMARRLLEKEQQSAEAPPFNPAVYAENPEIGMNQFSLSPLARGRDMALRGQGRAFQALRNAAERIAAMKLLQAEADKAQSAGVVQTTDSGPPASGSTTRSIKSSYGAGSATTSPSPRPGTFSFTNAAGEIITAPFSELNNPFFTKMMTEEETGRRVRGVEPKKYDASKTTAYKVKESMLPEEWRKA